MIGVLQPSLVSIQNRPPKIWKTGENNVADCARMTCISIGGGFLASVISVMIACYNKPIGQATMSVIKYSVIADRLRDPSSEKFVGTVDMFSKQCRRNLSDSVATEYKPLATGV
ncbi:unnamed protein product [Periconia digitata]|uniref:Uncharacterized protein n=1 Tax=Periconia digitata TaxID=1303443 RepID=A0A9W4XRH2_9PLEO|nr:unnamed protein product [Periconia digitata]